MHTTRVASLWSEMVEMLREEEQSLNAKAAQSVAAAEFRRELLVGEARREYVAGTGGGRAREFGAGRYA